jgi:hypothetical protein
LKYKRKFLENGQKLRNIPLKILLCFLLISTVWAGFEYTSPLDDLNSDFLVTEGAITGLISATDGIASWSDNSLSGFTIISGTAFTDGTATLTEGALSGLVSFEAETIIATTITGTTITGTTITDGTASLTGGNLSGIDTLTATTITIDGNSLDTTEWAYLDGLDQALKTTSSPTFATATVSTLSTGKLISTPDEITATSEGAAASVIILNTEVTTNGDGDLDNVTLANGTSGQIKHIYCVVEGNAADTWKITPANMCGGTQITFSGAGEGCILVYADSEGWVVVANNGGTIS